jgi:hypothetical protein
VNKNVFNESIQDIMLRIAPGLTSRKRRPWSN